MKPGSLFAAIAVSVLAYAPAYAQDPVIIEFSHLVTKETPKGIVSLACWNNGIKDMTGNKPLLHPNAN